MVQYTKLHSSAMCLLVDWDVLYIIYQKLSVLHLQSWKRLDMWLLKMRVQHLNLRLLRRPSTSRNLNELIIFLLPYNARCMADSSKVVHFWRIQYECNNIFEVLATYIVYHQYLRPHLFPKVMHHLPQKKTLRTSKQKPSCLQLIPLSIKVRLRE